jgi:hypothetical protein
MEALRDKLEITQPRLNTLFTPLTINGSNTCLNRICWGQLWAMMNQLQLEDHATPPADVLEHTQAPPDPYHLTQQKTIWQQRQLQSPQTADYLPNWGRDDLIENAHP